MPRSRLFLLAALAFGLASGAVAQPLMLPGASLQGGAEAAPAGQADPSQPGAPAAAPPTTRPVVAKNPAEETILNRDLKLNGAGGGLRIERAGKTDLKARVTLEGARLSRPGDACKVMVETPVPVIAKGRAEGLQRYEIQIPACPIAADLLDGALWVRAAEICAIEAADCRVDPRGLWGPEPAQLSAQARAIEGDRGQADRAVRENYKALTQRSRPQDVRAVVTEQAAFSSEREMLCRTYAREASHGFCNARFTEARAAQLAARLGLTPAAPAARRQGAVSPAKPVLPTPN